jgi:hypothetical protein
MRTQRFAGLEGTQQRNLLQSDLMQHMKSMEGSKAGRTKRCKTRATLERQKADFYKGADFPPTSLAEPLYDYIPRRLACIKKMSSPLNEVVSELYVSKRRIIVKCILVKKKQT